MGGMNGLWAIYILYPGFVGDINSFREVKGQVRGWSQWPSYTTYAHTNANLYDYMICHII